jgi:hypothetical protein
MITPGILHLSLLPLHHDMGHMLPDCVWEDVWRQLMITPGILHLSLLPLHHDVA